MKKGKIIQFIISLAIFFALGYSYSVITKDTIFDNLIMLFISIFLILFLWELTAYHIKKKMRRAKGEDVENVHLLIDEDMINAVEQVWNIDYKDHRIQVLNKYNQETLYINGELTDQKNRGKWYNYFKPYHELTGTIVDINQKAEVIVKLGGYLSLNCIVYVNGQEIFKDRIKFKNFLFGLERVDERNKDEIDLK